VPDRLRPLVGKSGELHSLGTEDPKIAKVRFLAVAAEVEERWKNLRRGPAPSHKDIQALGGRTLPLKGCADGSPGEELEFEGLKAGKTVKIGGTRAFSDKFITGLGLPVPARPQFHPDAQVTGSSNPWVQPHQATLRDIAALGNAAQGITPLNDDGFATSRRRRERP